MKKTGIAILFISMILVSGGSAWAAGLSAEAIVAKANLAAYYPGKDGRAHVKMTIVDKNGSSRSREFTILRMNLPGENQKFYVYFKAPADVYKMAYLVWKNIGKGDDRWLWLPALNLKKRIAPGDKRTSFVGSDFFYEDVSGRGIHEDNHTLVEETGEYYLIESTPKNPGEVEFAKFRTWIDKSTFLPKKAEYTDQHGEIYRVVESIKTETVQGYPTVLVAEAKDLRSGSMTRNEFSQVEYDLGLDERIFTERFLRRPPREIK